MSARTLLSELVEVPTQKASSAAFCIPERLVCTAQLSSHDRVRCVRHRRACMLIDLGGVVVEIACSQFRILRVFPRIAQHYHVSLLDGTPILVVRTYIIFPLKCNPTCVIHWDEVVSSTLLPRRLRCAA